MIFSPLWSDLLQNFTQYFQHDSWLISFGKNFLELTL